MDTYFAATAPGLEPFTAKELGQLLQPPTTGLESHPEPDAPVSKPSLHSSPSILQPSAGGVIFKGDLAALYRTNLHLRTASRILARVGNFFHATTFEELQERATRLPWERFLSPGQPVTIHVTCHQSKLFHQGAIARTIHTALEARLGRPSPSVKADEVIEGRLPQLVMVRIVDNQCTVSMDSSGELLYKRGYRQAVAKAPLRETLAAALLMASGWDKASPLLDPFCGSGTIPIEAALMALAIPPGINRLFAFMDWPNFDEQLWQSIQAKPASGLTSAPTILASDRDAGAIKMTGENAERAGVADWIEFKCQAVSSITPPQGGRGWVVTNPPYGVRVSEGKDLRNLYAQFGNVLRLHCPGWSVAVLCNDPILLGQMRLGLDTSLSFVNGGIQVRVARGMVG